MKNFFSSNVVSSRRKTVKLSLIGVFFASIILLLFVSCVKDPSIVVVPTIPTVSTVDATNVTTTSATLGGNVSSEGDASVQERGICWGLISNPSVNDNKISNGVGLGSFTGTINSLTAGTTYHARAYARNSVGTAYGSDVSFITTAIMYDVTLFSGVNGTASAPKQVAHGGSFEVTTVANVGFMTDSIKVNGLSFPLNGNTTYTVMNNLKPPVVYISFKQDPKWVLSQNGPWYTVMEQRRPVNAIPWVNFYPSNKILIERYEFYQSGNDFKIKTSWPDVDPTIYEYVVTVKGDSLIWGTKLDGTMGHRLQITHLDPQSLVLKGVVKYYILPDWIRVPEKDYDAQYYFEHTRSYK
ncbi:MAG: hypothetical protein NTV03_03175 [Candidatus Nomurabacteria bacterium]|nr:hypothetical protein [Candidatus Nomurabacteria bacterium]